MQRILPERFAVYGILFILSGFVLFHLLILIGLIPYDSVWGGRLKSREEMLSFEIPALLVNISMLIVVAMKARFINISVKQLILKVIFWLMFTLFLLNTAGNLLSTDKLEKTLFAFCTALLTLFSLRLALSKS